MPTLHLDKLLDPDSIVLIGASAREGSPGLALTRNLVDGGYKGRLYLVNPRYEHVLGLPCHRSLKRIEGDPDLALILTPQKLLKRTLIACAEKGIALALIMSGANHPKSLHEFARQLGIRLLGPWCAGLIRPHLGLNATFAATPVAAGSVALVSQSATLAAALVDWAKSSNVGFSALLSTGGATDIRLTDLLDVLADDPRTRAIIVYLDRVHSARAFLSALSAAARRKPVVLMQSSHDAARYCDALTRTGQVFSSDDIFDAALARAGAVRIHTFSNLYASAKILDSKLRTRGRRLAVISNGAAPAMLACENLEKLGFRSPLFDAATHAALNRAFGDSARNGRNPVVLREATDLANQYRTALGVLANAEGFDALLVIFVPDARNDPAEIAQAVIDSKPFKLPLLACWMGEGSVSQGRTAFGEAGIPTFRTPEAATDGIDFLYRYHVGQQQLLQLPNPASRETRADVAAARALVSTALADGKRLLGPQLNRELLTLFDVEVMPAIRAETLDEALDAARRIGFPVAMKLVSPNLTWKASVVPTSLDVNDEAMLTRLFDDARRTLTRERPDALFRGMLIERMHAPDNPRELRVGIHKDPTFGPVITIGIGGDLTALLQKRLVQLPPLNNFLIDQLFAHPSLKNYLGAFRHTPAVDTGPLRQVLRRLSELACELPQVVSLDINPLILSDGQAVALNMQIVLEQAHASRYAAASYGHLALHPYPWQWIRRIELRDGRDITLRPIRPEDAQALQAMVRSQSAESRYLRFLHAINDLSPLMLAQLTKLDYDRAMAFVADTQAETDGSSEAGELTGVARYSMDANATSAEFAVTVADAWQGLGLASSLMSLLIEHARERGLERLWGDVLKNNTAMHGLMKRLGFIGHVNPDDHELMVFELALDTSTSHGTPE